MFPPVLDGDQFFSRHIQSGFFLYFFFCTGRKPFQTGYPFWQRSFLPRFLLIPGNVLYQIYLFHTGARLRGALNTDCKIKPFIVHFFTPLNSCNSLPGTGYFPILFAIVKLPIIFLFQSFYHMVGIFIIRRRNPKFPPHADQRA